MTRRTDTTILFEQGQYTTVLEAGRRMDDPRPGTPPWCVWLDTDAIPSFGFSSEVGIHYTARRERRTRGGDYWYAYRKQDKRLRKVYAGRTHELNLARLVQVAQLLSGQGGSTATTAPNVKEEILAVPVEEIDITAAALDCAKDLIRFCVHRGDSVDSLAQGYMGSCNNRYHAHIGGQALLPGEKRARNIGCWKIVVIRVGERECCEIFKLRDLYKEVEAERMTIIECASCQHPLKFPDCTLEEVQVRFHKERCPLCSQWMFPLPPEVFLADPAARYLRLLAKALSYQGLMGDGSEKTVHLQVGMPHWEDFLATADTARIARATSQAIHLCRMLDIALPVAPGEEHLTWCSTERTIYDGRHDHRQPGRYQDSRGNWWCEACHDHHRLMEYGESLGYRMIFFDTTLMIRQGYQGWLSFAQTAGHRPVILACRIAAHLCASMNMQRVECKHQPCRHAILHQDYLGNGWCEYHATGYAFVCTGAVLDFPALPGLGVEAGSNAWMQCASSQRKDTLAPLLAEARTLLSQEKREVI